VGDVIRRIGITRIHIEEDAGKLIHDDSFDGTLADYNRCGVPLIEIVSEPDMRSADEAKAYLEAITTILLYLGVSDAKMQEGSVRADVNVSVRPMGQEAYGTRTEMKNVNSFGAVYRAIQYESARQIALIEDGGIIEQETRRWDDANGKSVLMRSKEDAQDYRYFPDPDLLTFEVSEEYVKALKDAQPELPVAKTLRYVKEFGLVQVDAQLLAANKARSDFFDACIAMKKCDPKLISNWMIGDIAKILNERRLEIADTALTKENLTDMVLLIEQGKISNTAAKTVLDVIMEQDKKPLAIVEEKGLAQVSDTGALGAIVNSILQNNAKAVEDFKNGKTNVVGFLVGQCMKASKGQGNPGILKDMIVSAIEKL
ncbi:MAG: Asp-tRNA(Asn)/Glu-tRNA(Gln) amidotransferase subunit GatB, partial [Ruthenibacterium sp.]